MRNTAIAVVVLITLVTFGSAAPQKSDALKSGTSDEPDFAGKILAVSVKEPARGGVIQNARLKKLGGRTFLVGDSVKSPTDPDHVDASYWFPIEDVQMIFEYKTVEDALKDHETAAKRRKGGDQ